ncbi:MAG: ASCH domain-containing protein [Candidatus Gastranaerophilales bacterium]|nr:ASCH domain-containing protein [Candidatus Gastranaerophilales bacterium]
MLIFNLKKEWFDKIKRGEKTHEYRDFKRYFEVRLNNLMPNEVVLFRNGYVPNPDKELLTKIKHISVIQDGMQTDLKHNNPVYDIEFELIDPLTDLLDAYKELKGIINE